MLRVIFNYKHELSLNTQNYPESPRVVFTVLFYKIKPVTFETRLEDAEVLPTLTVGNPISLRQSCVDNMILGYRSKGDGSPH